MTQSKAIVAQVKLGTVTLDGLMMPNGEYRVGLSQLEKLNLIPPNRSLKQLKALTGMGFQSHQKAQSELHPKAVNTIDLTDLTQLLLQLGFRGSKEAQELLLCLADLSLTELFNDAFGKKSDAKERQEFLKARGFGKVNRRSFTDSVQNYLTYHPDCDGNVYAKATNLMYLLLFKQTRKQLEESLGGPVRDKLTYAQVQELATLERLAASYLDKNPITPIEAVKQAYLLLQ